VQYRHSLRWQFAEIQFATVVEKKRPVLEQTLIVVATPRHGNADACNGGHKKSIMQPRVRPPNVRPDRLVTCLMYL